MIHALTIDVEDYYSVFARDRLGLDGPPTAAVVRNTARLMDLLASRGVRGTFFVLGEVAAAWPQLVRDLAAAGHEVGVHGFTHRQVFRMTRELFREEVARAKQHIEDLLGRPAPGHRAPAFSIGPDTAWALEVLAELGFTYDSSVFPIAGRRYGWPGFRPDIHRVALPGGASIIEAPLSTVRLPGKALPCGGGGYLRHLPYAYNRLAIKWIGRRRPALVYLHPYELDVSPEPEDFAAALRKAPADVREFHARQLRKRATVEGKVRRLLDEFQFAPLGEIIAAMPAL